MLVKFSPFNVVLFVIAILSCVACVFTAKHNVVLSVVVFIPLANLASIILQWRLISNIGFTAKSSNKFIHAFTFWGKHEPDHDYLKRGIAKGSFTYPEVNQPFLWFYCYEGFKKN